MRQVHEVVDHQHVVALDRIQSCLLRPVRACRCGRGNRRSCAGRPAPPRPSRSTRTGPSRRRDRRARARRRGCGLAGHVHALAAAVEDQAVIAALDAAPRRSRRSDSGAERWQQRSSSAAALPGLVAEQHDGLVADAAGQRLVLSISSAQAAMYQALRMNMASLPRRMAPSTSPSPLRGEGWGEGAARSSPNPPHPALSPEGRGFFACAILPPCRATSSPRSARTIARACARSRSSGSIARTIGRVHGAEGTATPRASSAPRSRAMPSASTIPTG